MVKNEGEKVMAIIQKGKKYAVVKDGIIQHLGSLESCREYVSNVSMIFG